MASKPKPGTLSRSKGWSLFAASWIVTFVVVWGLRQALIPREELDCFSRVKTLQGAVDRWDKSHPEKAYKDTDEIDEAKMLSGGFLKQLSYDHDRHYYFVGQTAHGLWVKCNKHQDNPLVLKLTGITLLAVLVFAGLCMARGYRLFDP